jgi:hypothetical protein
VRYRKKSQVVEATQWLRIGDHDLVQQYHPPEHVIPENPYCPTCGNLMERHGQFDGSEGWEIVCPGDYIVIGNDGVPALNTRAQFESMFEPYVRPQKMFEELPPSDLEERVRRRRPRQAP